jgi:hypothetical protein
MNIIIRPTVFCNTGLYNLLANRCHDVTARKTGNTLRYSMQLNALGYVREQFLRLALSPFYMPLYTPFYTTNSLWRRQSQQSFNTLTPFNFFFYSLHVSAPTGHPQVRYTIRYYFCFWRTILIQRIRCTYAIWLYGCYLSSSIFQLIVLIHVIVVNIKICKISKIPRY